MFFAFGLSRGNVSTSLLLPCTGICNRYMLCVPPKGNGAILSHALPSGHSERKLRQPANWTVRRLAHLMFGTSCPELLLMVVLVSCSLERVFQPMLLMFADRCAWLL